MSSGSLRGNLTDALLIKSISNVMITATVVIMLFFSCKGKSEETVAVTVNPDSIATMITTSVSTLISDSGITRYKMVADVWMVFDQAKDPYWYFPEGLYLEQFTPDFEIEAIVKADTAWRFTARDLWQLKGSVHVENRIGEQFDSEELFWDQKNGEVYSDAYIKIQSGATEMKGYGFKSNTAMTDYRIFKPHDGKLPFSESVPGDSISDSSVDTEMN